MWGGGEVVVSSIGLSEGLRSWRSRVQVMARRRKKTNITINILTFAIKKKSIFHAFFS